jgi:hypothetical protein
VEEEAVAEDLEVIAEEEAVEEALVAVEVGLVELQGEEEEASEVALEEHQKSLSSPTNDSLECLF